MFFQHYTHYLKTNQNQFKMEEVVSSGGADVKHEIEIYNSPLNLVSSETNSNQSVAFKANRAA